jgi:hypothetical protein
VDRSPPQWSPAHDATLANGNHRAACSVFLAFFDALRNSSQDVTPLVWSRHEFTGIACRVLVVDDDPAVLELSSVKCITIVMRTLLVRLCKCDHDQLLLCGIDGEMEILWTRPVFFVELRYLRLKTDAWESPVASALAILSDWN